MAPRHAQLYAQGASWLLVDLNTEGGTFVNGERIPPGQPVEVQPGSLFRFGEGGPLALFEFTASLQLGPMDLVLRREDPPGGTWLLNGPTHVGRHEACHIQLDPARDVLASSQHIHLMPAFGRLVVTDINSANGTFMGGRRVLQAVMQPGSRIHLGGETGPTFCLDAEPATQPATAPEPPAGPPPIPDTCVMRLQAGGQEARLDVVCKTQVRFGSFAGLNDFETACFPRELESESDALDRSEKIGFQHGTLVLTEQGVDLVDGGYAPTKLNGTVLEANARVPLGDVFDLAIGGDAVGFRGRMFRHPNLQHTAPQIGMEGQHPVECLTLERKGDGPNSRLLLQLVRTATIGSADEAAIRIAPDLGVAHMHAMIYHQTHALWITQVGSDPVAVNGVALSPGTTLPLPLGSVVYIGAVRLELTEE